MKNILLLLLLSISVFSNAQTTIKMEKDGGIYKVKCKVNGAPMKMYFDTGATAVSISRATAMYLYDNDLITKEDFIGKARTTTAEGAITDNMVIRLKDVEIGGLHLRNVEAVVTSSLNAPLLLGQTVISKLGKITLDGDILTIHSANSQSLSDEQRNKLDAKLRELRANRFTDFESDYKILDIIKKIEKSEQLNEFELFCKVVAEANKDKYDEAIVDAETWIEKYAIDTDNTDMKMRVYFVSAKSHLLSENGDKDLGMQHLSRCSSYYINDTTEYFFWHHLPNLQYEYCKYKKNGFANTIIAAKHAINHFLKSEKVNLKDINNNKHLGSPLQVWFQNLAFYYSEHYTWINNTNHTQWSDNQIKMLKLCSILAAKLGAPESIEYCQQNGYNYKKTLSQKDLDFVGIEDK